MSFKATLLFLKSFPETSHRNEKPQLLSCSCFPKAAAYLATAVGSTGCGMAIRWPGGAEAHPMIVSFLTWVTATTSRNIIYVEYIVISCDIIFEISFGILEISVLICGIQKKHWSLQVRNQLRCISMKVQEPNPHLTAFGWSGGVAPVIEAFVCHSASGSCISGEIFQNESGFKQVS